MTSFFCSAGFCKDKEAPNTVGRTQYYPRKFLPVFCFVRHVTKLLTLCCFFDARTSYGEGYKIKAEAEGTSCAAAKVQTTGSEEMLGAPNEACQ